MTQRAIAPIIGAAGCLMIGALFSGLIPAVEFRREWINVTVRPEAFEVSWSSEVKRQGHVALALPPQALILQSGELV